MRAVGHGNGYGNGYGNELGEENMVAIRVLPPEIVNRIAAGEVVERPASVVKELIENAIDAGADEIALHVEDGGKKRIRVRDNGGGMTPEDLPLAFQSHSTSKLPLLDSPETASGLDLFMIETLGFRGEALASIASVAEIEVTSRTAGSECAYRFRPGPSAAGPEPSAAPPGTTVDVRNIFSKLPARRKFLRATSTELSHVVEQVVRLALAHPEVAFSMTHGKREVLDVPRSDGLASRVARILGEERARDLIEIPARDHDGVRVQGLVAPPHIHRSDAKGQNFFVNGRWVRDRVLAHAVREAYSRYQIPGRQPIAYLLVDVPREQVDVNVHPQKTEIRFHDSRRVHRAVHAAVSEALEGVGVRPARAREAPAQVSGTGAAAPPSPGARAAVRAAFQERVEKIRDATRDHFDLPARGERGARPATRRPAGTTVDPTPVAPPRQAAANRMQTGAPSRPRAIQVLREFIVTESDEGLLLIDQHALHEKVLHERILRQLRDASVPAQRLLLPEVVALPDELAPFVPRLIELMARFGFELEPFGDREVAIQAIPVVIDREPARDIIREVADWIRDDPRGDEEGAGGVVDEILHRVASLMACKQAVKAGTSLGDEEIAALLEESDAATDPRYCPHGRPTAIVLTRGELERRFDRR